MQVRTLQFELIASLAHLKPGLVRAVKMNASLRTVVGMLRIGYQRFDEDDRDLFNEDDKRKLNYYATRNEGLSQWIASPATLPRGDGSGYWTGYCLSHSPSARSLDWTRRR
jgi:hypothetical protein